MKTLFTFLLTLVITSTFAQQGINYKAIVKDDLGNVIANQSITIQFSILKGAGQTNEYTETHNPTTDSNGIAIVNIGNGIVVSGNYSGLDWGSDTHHLNVQIDLGSGLVEMGTTAFKAVPYALRANKSSSSIEVSDQDNDTKIQVEETADEDIIRFDIEGTEFFRMDRGRLEVDNTGNSIFIGENTGLNDDFSSNQNIGLGSFALWENVTGNNNVAIGYGAMSESEGSSGNLAIGIYTLSLTTGDNNIALGGEALFSNTSGSGNIALGQEAMYSNDTGANNIANGVQALYNNTSGNANIANGYQALFSNTSGQYNLAIGNEALRSNSTGHNNVAHGGSSLKSNTSGFRNIAIGSAALRQNTTGNYNIGIGDASLFGNSTGNNNIGLGRQTLSSNTTGTNNIAIGQSALFSNTTGNDNITSGYQALYSNTTGSNNISNGYQALYNNTTGNDNIAIGKEALRANSSGRNNIANGNSSLLSNTIGSSNIALGGAAMEFNTTGSYNFAAGLLALRWSSTGSYNIAIGYQALHYNSAGSHNIAFGEFAMEDNNTGFQNISMGRNSFQNGNMDYNNAIVIGSDSYAGGDNTVRLGNSTTTSIGGAVIWSTISDGRFKTNVKEDVIGLDFILKLRPVTYNLNPTAISKFYKSDNIDQNAEAAAKKAAIVETGFIAQEVEVLAKSLGYDFSGVDAPQDETQHYGLRYASFVVPLVKAVQEQQAIIDAQQEIIENQNTNYLSLLERVEALEEANPQNKTVPLLVLNSSDQN